MTAINSESDMPTTRKAVRLDVVVISCALLGLSALYASYVVRSYSDVFYEADFLHIPFLRDLASGHFRENDVLQTLGEHLFPGYNLLLALNYYAFSVWGGFDYLLTAASVIASAAIITVWLFRKMGPLRPADLLCLGAILVPLLSPINNPMWGMALAASIGTMLMALAAIIVGDRMDRRSRLSDIVLCFLIPVDTLLFCGGYSVGFVSCMLAASFGYAIYDRRMTTYSIGICILSLCSLAIYMWLVSRQHPIFADDATTVKPSTMDSVRFAIVMAASTVLGKATLEQNGDLNIYFLFGVLLWSCVIAAMISQIRRLIKRIADSVTIFNVIILSYAVVTIVFVSIFRASNGIDGAPGQWYITHTKYLPVALLIEAWRLARGTSMVRRAVATVATFVIVVGSLLGYHYDYLKAPSAAAWKDQFKDQAGFLLVQGLPPGERSDWFKSMVWDYDTVKPGIDFLYSHRLWIFNSDKPVVLGLSSDSWLLADHDVAIVCPAGSQALNFDVMRPSGWPSASLKIASPTGIEERPIDDKQIDIALDRQISGVVISRPPNATSTAPLAGGDERPLFANISHIICH